MIIRLDSKTGEWTNPAERFLCNFGLIEGALIAVGVGASTAAVAAPVILGAGAGALESGITGGDPLLGALTGGVSGGLIGIGGPLLGEAAGIGTFGGDLLAGGAAGLINSGISGTDPLTGLATGAASGALAGVTSSLGASGGGAGSATGSAAPGAGAPDISAQLGEATGALPAGDLTGPLGTGAAAGTSALSSGAATAGFGATDNLNLSLPGGGTNIDVAGGGFDQFANNVSAAGGAGSSGGGLNIGGGTGGGGADLAQINGLTPAQQISALPTAQPGNFGNVQANLDPSLGKSGNFITQGLQDLGVGDKTAGLIGNNAGALVAGGGLAMNLLQGNELPAGTNELTGAASNLLTQGQQLSSYLGSGTLPPGAKAALDRGTQAAKAEVRSRYASMGLSGSTMEAQDVASIDQHASQQGFEIAQQLLQTGIKETGLATGIYENLIRLNQEQNAATGSAIASFAAALSGGSRSSANA